MRGFAFILIAALLPAAACQGDETVRAYGAANKVWALQTIDDHPFSAQATLSFAEVGRIVGRAPCNQYSAEMTVPYPWFKAGPILSTKMACPDLQAESRYFESLAQMSAVEVLGEVMILKSVSGREMVFKPAASATQ